MRENQFSDKKFATLMPILICVSSSVRKFEPKFSSAENT